MWLAREVVIPARSPKALLRPKVSHYVVFHCRRTETHPVCHTARYVEGASSEVIWRPRQIRKRQPRRVVPRQRSIRSEEAVRLRRRYRVPPTRADELRSLRPVDEPLIDAPPEQD
jgi:hypothetical protein